MTPPRPDLDDVRAFCCVVDHGSLTAAARALGETKGSISRRVSRLEAAVGTLLLRRSPRLVQPTEDGARFRERVGLAIELFDDASAELREAGEPQGQLRVTAPVDLALTTLGPIVAAFAREVPAVTVELVLTDALLDFDAHRLDVAIRATGSLPSSSLIARPLGSVEAQLFAAPAYFRGRKAPTTTSELANERLLLREPTPLTLHDRDRRPHVVATRPAIVASDFAFLRALAVDGAGVALLPAVIARDDVARKRLVRVLPHHVGFRASLYVVHRGGRFVPPKVRAFADRVIAGFSS